jgi:hypothetical protein
MSQNSLTFVHDLSLRTAATLAAAIDAGVQGRISATDVARYGIAGIAVAANSANALKAMPFSADFPKLPS